MLIIELVRPIIQTQLNQPNNIPNVCKQISISQFVDGFFYLRLGIKRVFLSELMLVPKMVGNVIASCYSFIQGITNLAKSLQDMWDQIFFYHFLLLMAIILNINVKKQNNFLNSHHNFGILLSWLRFQYVIRAILVFGPKWMLIHPT